MGDKRTVLLILPAAVAAVLVGAGEASAAPAAPAGVVVGTGVVPPPVPCPGARPRIPGTHDTIPGGGQMIHPCGPR